MTLSSLSLDMSFVSYPYLMSMQGEGGGELVWSEAQLLGSRTQQHGDSTLGEAAGNTGRRVKPGVRKLAAIHSLTVPA